MAFRIQNMGKNALALDLRDGETIYLNAHEVSRPLREESLYSNPNLPQWLASGLVRQLDAHMSEVLAFEEELPAGEEPGIGDDGAVEESAAEESGGEGNPPSSGKKAGTKKSGSKLQEKSAQESERG
jgi:hypothetical protein